MNYNTSRVEVSGLHPAGGRGRGGFSNGALSAKLDKDDISRKWSLSASLFGLLSTAALTSERTVFIFFTLIV